MSVTVIDEDILKEIYEASRISEKVEIKRRQDKITQRDLVKLLDMPLTGYAKYIKNKEVPTATILRKMFSFVSLNIDEYLSEEYKNVLNIRSSLNKELSFVHGRIRELKASLDSYTKMKDGIIEQLNRCDNYFEVDLELPMDVNYSFSGKGSWVSNKFPLRKGIYKFQVTHENKTAQFLGDLYNADTECKTKSIYGRNEIIEIKQSGYYVLNIYQSPAEWIVNITNSFPMIEEF